jgi:prepilin-type N-terminal cleavage/methylation domain-containing protein
MSGSTQKKRQRGFSLIELMIVGAIILVLSGYAIIATNPSSLNNNSNAAEDSVVDTLRQARQLAISKRRNVLVTFTNPNSIQLAVQTLPNEAAATPIAPVLLNGGMNGGAQFMQFAGLPNTPMGPLGFGNSSAIDLEPVNGGGVGNAVMFTTAGSFVGAGGAAPANYYSVGNNDPVNATIFIGIQPAAGQTNTLSARAITVVGATGRVRGYTWNGTAWQE